MRLTATTGPLAAAVFASASYAQGTTSSSPPDLSGQYDGWSGGGFQLFCPVDEPATDCVAVPFTPEGEAAARAFDYAAYQEQYASSCTVARMPEVTNPGRYLLGIHQSDDLVNVVYQRTDTIRGVRMSAGPPPEKFPGTRLGYSVGRWEGDTLVIVTTNLTGGYIGSAGLPYSEQSRVTERYSLDVDTGGLAMEVTLADPVNYSAPFVLSRTRFDARPEWDWTPWNCSVW